MRNDLDQGLPQSTEAETVVLGSILMDNARYQEASTLSVDCFFLDSNRRIFRAMGKLAAAGKPIDSVTLHEEMRGFREIETVGGGAYLSTLTDGLIRRSSIEHHVRLLMEKSQLRQIIHKANDAIAAAMEGSPSAEVLENLRVGLDGIVANSPETNRDLFVSARSFMEQAKPEVEWRVRKVIEVGTNGFIIALPKTGKSMLVCDLAIALATGDQWLEFETNRCRVALVSREDYAGTTARRLQRLMLGRQFDPNIDYLSDWLWVSTRQQAKHLALDNATELATLIKNLQRHKTEFLILDVLNVLHEKDENDNTEMRSVMKRIEKIRDEVGCQVCIIHHSVKNAEEGASLSKIARGSSAIAGFAEFIVQLLVVDEESHARQIRFDSKAAEAHFSFHWEIVDQPSSGGVVVRRRDWNPPQRARRTSR